SGLNVVARRVSLGDYPPAPTLDPYGGQAIPVDEDGAPLPPAPRNEIDPLLTSTSIVSGVLGGNGVFNFVGLPPGDYLVSVETINPDALGGSSIGQRDPQIGFIIAENYNGANESSDPNRDRPREFSPVRVNAGSITTGIDFFLNNYGSSITSADEQENNDAKKAAQRLSGDQIISGNVSESDSSRIKVDFGGNNGSLNIHDLYRVTLTQNTSLALFLDAENTSSDIDLFLFSRDLKNGTVPINSSSIISVSFTATGSEAIVENLAPGTYFIGVSGALGTTKYKLTVAQRR
ncbi:MAG: carboxypeptidase regulatory-like domain-containing protein, partial [Blastocatellia bacterium]|nr:carboxypeptidase regulatory-like domain-containing protein [Blastocatellia bacterium]